MPPSVELVADKAYDSQALREWLGVRGTEVVIPPRKNRKIQYDFDPEVYNAMSSSACSDASASRTAEV